MNPPPSGAGPAEDEQVEDVQAEDVQAEDVQIVDEHGARRRHPSAHPWRTDHLALERRLAAHLEAQGWSRPEARAAADQARRTADTRR